MKYVRQRLNTDCAVAAFAMIMNLSYGKAMKILHPNRFWWFETASTDLMTIQKGCRQLGYDTQIYDSSLDFRDITTRAILIIRINDTKNHAVVWDPLRHIILNPHPNSCLTPEFYLENFLGSCFIVPGK